MRRAASASAPTRTTAVRPPSLPPPPQRIITPRPNGAAALSRLPGAPTPRTIDVKRRAGQEERQPPQQQEQEQAPPPPPPRGRDPTIAIAVGVAVLAYFGVAAVAWWQAYGPE